MIEHAAIHRRRDQEWTGRGQRHHRQQGVGISVGEFGNRIGGAGRDDQQIGGMCQPHVQHVSFIAPQIGIGIGASTRDRLEGQRHDELFCCGAEDHIHLRFGLCQFGSEVCDFIGRDGTCHPECDMFVRENRHALSLYFQEKGSSDGTVTLQYQSDLQTELSFMTKST